MTGQEIGVLFEGFRDFVALLEESFFGQFLMMSLVREGDGLIFDIESDGWEFDQSAVWSGRSLSVSFPETRIVGQRVGRFGYVFRIKSRIGRRRRSSADENVGS